MFKLDTASAKSADNKSAFIDEAGKYVGAFTRAEWMEKSSTGSTGIGLTFKTTEGQEAHFYVNLSYQHGTQNRGGHATLNAIMACLRVREVPDPVQITVEKWDSDTKQRVKSQVNGFPVLMGKPIGLVLQMLIEKTSEKGQPRPQIYGVFETATEKVATEILDQANPEPAILAKMIAAISAKPLVDLRTHGKSEPQAGQSTAKHAGDFEEDDIPF